MSKLITKKDLIELGFPEERIIVINAPVILIGDRAYNCRKLQFDDIKKLRDTEFFINCVHAGYMMIMENPEYLIDDGEDDFILRCI